VAYGPQNDELYTQAFHGYGCKIDTMHTNQRALVFSEYFYRSHHNLPLGENDARFIDRVLRSGNNCNFGEQLRLLGMNHARPIHGKQTRSRPTHVWMMGLLAATQVAAEPFSSVHAGTVDRVATCFQETEDPIETFAYYARATNDTNATADWSLGNQPLATDSTQRAVVTMFDTLSASVDDAIPDTTVLLGVTASAVEHAMTAFKLESENHRDLAVLYTGFCLIVLGWMLSGTPTVELSALDFLMLVTATRATQHKIARISPIHGAYNTCITNKADTLESNVACETQLDSILGKPIQTGQGICLNNRCYSRDTIETHHSTGPRDPFTNSRIGGTIPDTWSPNSAIGAAVLDGFTGQNISVSALDMVRDCSRPWRSRLMDKLTAAAYLYLLYRDRTWTRQLFQLVPALSAYLVRDGPGEPQEPDKRGCRCGRRVRRSSTS
jgi:hypothetical protein